MSIEIIPLVVEALHSLEARKLASRECNASTTRGIISILIVLVGSNYLLQLTIHTNAHFFRCRPTHWQTASLQSFRPLNYVVILDRD